MDCLELIQSNEEQPPAKNYIDNLPNEILLEIFAFGALGSCDTAFSFRVSTTCRLWRSLAISEARLWTSLTVTGTTACIPEPRHAVDALDAAEVIFPRETLILERSADLDVDVEILVDSHLMGTMPGETQVPPCFTSTHFLYLSCLLASHAYHIRSFFASTRDFKSIIWLCMEFRWVVMPRLKKLVLSCPDNIASDLSFSEEYEVEPVHVLEYATEDIQPSSQELQRWSGALYPLLKDVECSGVPYDWNLFSASNLQNLCLAYQPWDDRPSMETLRGILSNSMNTLESLVLACVIDIDSGLPPPATRLVLPRVQNLTLGYAVSQEIQVLLRAFEFPAINKLVIQPSEAGTGTADVFINVMNYLPLDQLQILELWAAYFGSAFPGPDPELVKEGIIAEEALPVALQFIRRLPSLRVLSLHFPCSVFLKYMNYPVTRRKDGIELSPNKAVNMAGLRGLLIHSQHPHIDRGVVSFLRERLEQGTVNGKYVGPVMSAMTLFLSQASQEAIESLGDLKLAEQTRLEYF
ncbi:hypothetical protein EV421DRAFT_341562 [Armillaria borealis]|uniref:F-box domain-containing protein n=1 Tax=Armillaria borealis TaxID=47425 RepID=A0AA39JLU3_9AGAR|nr:hypothetical protein EV421DRAFT_341562 [Armillaria borealis]